MKTHNYIMGALFGISGLVCLYAALFLAATHQLLMAIIGFGMAAALIYDVRKNVNHGTWNTSLKQDKLWQSLKTTVSTADKK